ncbi:MAG TPA: FHA domain-containing protein [Galbitalea sp.]
MNADENYDDLDDTITVPRLPYVEPALPLPPELEDTVIPTRDPPPLVMPEIKPRLETPSGIELAPIDGSVAEAPWAPVDAFGMGDTAPLYYSYRIGHTVVWLDVESYVGRRPSSPRILSGRMPRLVRVPSPAQEVSSTHIEVRQLGASVVVTDLKSTNGSVIIAPGSLLRKLRQGESVVVIPGTLIDIGDGNVLEILPLGRRSAGEAQHDAPEEGRE